MQQKKNDFIEALTETIDNGGLSLAERSDSTPVLVVFLRHGGCTFCREALSDIRDKRPTIERAGTATCLVHMMNDDEARKLFASYGLDDLPRISDPDRSLYHAFGLEQGRIGQLLNWKVWWRGIVAGIIHRHGAGRLMGDGRQMPGVFLLEKNRIVRSFRHRTAADRPDYIEVSGCSLETGPVPPAKQESTHDVP
jgi:peroxiredoxin